MPTRFIRHHLLFLALATGLASCLKAPDFSHTPTLSAPQVNIVPTFDDFSKSQKDSVIVSVQFQDGDGDLGVTAEERNDTINNYKDWGNYELRTFQYDRGAYKELTLDVNKRLFFFPLYKPGKDGKGALEGTLRFSQSFFRDRTSKLVPVKFRIKIRDRKLQESNTVETDTIRVPLTL